MSGKSYMAIWCTRDVPNMSYNSSDTRVLLTSTNGGKVTPMTENHHAEARVESVRLRRMMGGLTTDSFGEVRYASLSWSYSRGLAHFLLEVDGGSCEHTLSRRSEVQTVRSHARA